MVTKETKQATIKSHQLHSNDVGSPQVQVAILTDRIKHLTEHMKLNKQDQLTRRGLMQMVGKRKKLLGYLKETDSAAYLELIQKLGLRK